MPTLLARLDGAQRRVRPAAFVVAVWLKFSEDSAGYFAVLLAFYAFLAVFPLLLLLATVLGIVLGDYPAAQQSVIHSALADFPVIGTQLRANVHSLSGSGFGLTVGLIGTLWGARGLTTCAQTAFSAIWAIPYPRRANILRRQSQGLALLGVIVLDVLATGALSEVSGVGDGHALWLESIGAAATTVVNALLFTVCFRLATPRLVPTHAFVRSACATAVFWQALLSLGTYLVAHELRHAEDLYGVFGLVLGLIAWLTVQSRVTILLLEADCVRMHRLWPRTLDGPDLVPGDVRAFDAYAAAQQRRPGMRVVVEYADADAADLAPDYSVDPAAGYSPALPAAVVSQPSAGTRSSTPVKSTPPDSVPNARP